MVHTTALLEKQRKHDTADLEELGQAIDGPSDEETLHRLDKKAAA